MDFARGGVQIRISSGRQVSDMPLNSLQESAGGTWGEKQGSPQGEISASVRHRSGGAKNR